MGNGLLNPPVLWMGGPRGWQRHCESTLSLAPQQEGKVIAQHEMVAAIENALDVRRQRIVPGGHPSLRKDVV